MPASITQQSNGVSDDQHSTNYAMPSKQFSLDTADAIVSNILARRQAQNQPQVQPQAQPQAQMQSQPPNPAPVQAFVQTTDQAQTQQRMLNKNTSVMDVEVMQQQDTIASVVPTAVDQMYQEQQQQIQSQAATGVSSGKESLININPDSNQVEAGASLQYVEQEKNPEMPPEVEGFLQHVDSHVEQAPQEIVLSNVGDTPLPTRVPKKSVIVLPITPEIEKLGGRKGPKYSVKWLVEWSRKIIKMFQGTVVYRPVQENQENK